MKRHTYTIIFLLLAFNFTSTVAYGSMYRWTDNNGNLHVTDDPSKIPDEYREKRLVTTEDVDIKSKETTKKQFTPTTDDKSKPAVPEAQSTSFGGLSITSPVAGTTVHAGNSLAVHVDSQTAGTLVGVMIICGGDGVFFGSEFVVLPPYNVTVQLPHDYTGTAWCNALGKVLGQKTGKPPEANVQFKVTK